MSWKQWSLKEWNDSLVRAVFIGHEHSDQTVSRIDASGRFLARCTKDQECDPEEARQLFITSFGNTDTSVRAKFRWSASLKVTSDPNKIPSCFAALYLTLLAASADNETAGLGDFRNRFSEIVKVTYGHSIDFGRLPLMWTAVQAWTVLRNKLIGDCSLLVLPNPKREKLIGYSKRIAFPAYKDEIFLRKTLQRSNLSETSPFGDVALAVAREINSANTLENFKEEFREFSRLVVSAENQSAYESPFWGAVRDISFEEAQELVRKKGLAYLEIYIPDPADPQLNLYLDELASKSIEMPIKELNIARRDGCKFIAFEEGHQPSANRLQLLVTNRKNFKDFKIGKLLFEGWLIFLPDQIGQLTTDGSFYEGGPICIVAKNSLLDPLIKFCDSLRLNPMRLSSNGVLNGWSGLHIQSTSELMFKRILSYAPAAIEAMFRKGWAPPRPRISGGSWYGQMLLLNPASNPVVKMNAAVKGEYRFLGDNSDEVTRGKLVVQNDGFQIPFVDLISIAPNVHVCEFILITAEEKTKTLKILLIANPPEGQPAQLRDSLKWLVDSPTGILWRMDEVKEAGSLKETIGKQKLLPSNLFPPTLKIDSNIPNFDCNNSDSNVMAPALNWLTDALTLRFERRSSLTFELLNEHVKGAAELAGHNLRDLRKLLLYGQWLKTQTQRSAPYSSVSRTEIEMIVTNRNGGVFARVAGMLSRQSTSKLAKILHPSETCLRISTADAISIGCIEITVLSVERASEIAQEIGARIVMSNSEILPFSALTPSASEIQVMDSPVGCYQSETWNWGWSPSGNAQASWPLGELRRTINGPKAWHWIKLSENQFAKTDSISWAWMVSSIVAGRNVAFQDKGGSIVWDKNIISLPASLTRWWMLYGGGCIALTREGSFIFTGYNLIKAIDIMGWRSDRKKIPTLSIALNRRKMALSLKKSRRLFVNFSN